MTPASRPFPHQPVDHLKPSPARSSHRHRHFHFPLPLPHHFRHHLDHLVTSPRNLATVQPPTTLLDQPSRTKPYILGRRSCTVYIMCHIVGTELSTYSTTKQNGTWAQILLNPPVPTSWRLITVHLTSSFFRSSCHLPDLLPISCRDPDARAGALQRSVQEHGKPLLYGLGFWV